jgi:folate-dependent tRNA-U54 methylase TrmFO/GidA
LRELKIWNSLILQAAIESEVPAGGCLAVDRKRFSANIDQKIKTHPNINLIQQEINVFQQHVANLKIIVRRFERVVAAQRYPFYAF